ncbi:MAG TPA: sarcosine oxidase subunit alpha family protein [Stellaceae bacterium]|nr:sarcosine oxidase subunit alpha family protein [Stellaceae bacterium]
MTQPFRLRGIGHIDRSRTIRFGFNGRDYEGHPGDTLASALLANGVRLVARSWKFHRPRGIFAAGMEEPSALVRLGEDINRRATDVALCEGLAASSQHAWPNLAFDIAAPVGWLGRLFPAGFYYKMFFRSPALWRRVWEPLLRRMAGLGTAPRRADPVRCDKVHAHCDVLVVGAGPAGLAAALAAGRGGARVILAEADREPGGSLLRRPAPLDAGWLEAAVAALKALPETRVLTGTTVFGRYDGNHLLAAERGARDRLWHIRARRVVLATGAIERPLVFPGNDRPGVMLAGAVETYVNRYAVAPGRQAVLFTNNDDAYHAAAALKAAGVAVAAIVDPRPAPGVAARALAAGITLHPGHVVVATSGRRRLRRVTIQPIAGQPIAGQPIAGQPIASGARTGLDCDLLAVSGGWNPAVHLFAHAGGRLRYDDRLAAFIPDAASDTTVAPVGGANGCFDLAACLAEGAEAGARAAAACGYPSEPAALPDVSPVAETAPQPLWLVPGGAGRKSFVDLHNDVTAADIALAAREGFTAIEHVKRWTTLGMGTDQGRTGNIPGLALLSQELGRAIAETGTTTFRPPYVPVGFALLAGRERSGLFDPVRRTPIHEWHVAAGAVFEDVGQWKRPRHYPRPGETMGRAVRRECLAARDAVALLDASTLGKIEVSGPDAARFLDRLYINRWSNLGIGRCRYGVMCRDDGMVFDDGVGTRLAADRFFLTTTTGNAGAVLDWFEEWLQTEWPELDVFCTSLTEQFANATLVGPRARDVLAAAAPRLDLAAFPFMAMREADVAGIPARILRVSFSGELSYEINVPAEAGPALWQRLMSGGEGHGITPYGTEAMHVLRAEKGYFMVGQETDGSVTPLDLGLAVKDEDCLGRRALSRPDTARPDRKQLVGLLPDDPNLVLPEGAQLIADPQSTAMLGHVTSSYFGARIGRSFALALVSGGRQRHGAPVWAYHLGCTFPARICPPVFYDPAGQRRDG